MAMFRSASSVVLRTFTPQSSLVITRSLATGSMASKFYSFTIDKPKGEKLALKDLQGKVVLVVNVASKCGLTPQYKGLQSLYDKYHDKGLEILGFPCNQFGGQEPGTDAEIAEFCDLNYKVSFPLMKKVDVNGENAHELYKWLKHEKPGLLSIEAIKWNFEKFLIDQNGNIVHRYAPTTGPDSIESEIAKLLDSSKL
ncbi:glutathione peroxidase [Exidia glandulosa HHB12029]|uniref:Glutathione peroxidase n=1 Tax=Exidia glandulosa HHB12029 TaxID=1314781 RepID=A0A165GI09_EXIGL|nr:glutathione peroxidase [Exidia glandulosa HHB12029]